MEKVDRI